MKKFKSPSEKMVLKILTEVGFEDRLTGFNLHRRLGVVTVSLYSFSEAVSFLENPYSMVDFSSLEAWLRRKMEDNELADEVHALAGRDISDARKTELIAALMALRLEQCLGLDDNIS